MKIRDPQKFPQQPQNIHILWKFPRWWQPWWDVMYPRDDLKIFTQNCNLRRERTHLSYCFCRDSRSRLVAFWASRSKRSKVRTSSLPCRPDSTATQSTSVEWLWLAPVDKGSAFSSSESGSSVSDAANDGAISGAPIATIWANNKSVCCGQWFRSLAFIMQRWNQLGRRKRCETVRLDGTPTASFYWAKIRAKQVDRWPTESQQTLHSTFHPVDIHKSSRDHDDHTRTRGAHN